MECYQGFKKRYSPGVWEEKGYLFRVQSLVVDPFYSKIDTTGGKYLLMYYYSYIVRIIG